MPARSTSRDPLSPRPLLLGVIHLPPLPGSPGWKTGSNAWLARAEADAALLDEAGFDGVIVENYGDAPFFKETVPPETVAAMSSAARQVRDVVSDEKAVGVNVLRNDAFAALAVAAACELDFIRVNVLSGAAMTDQGLIETDAANVLRTRTRLCPRVKIFADVRVKHAAPLAERPIDDEARDLVGRGGADGVLVSGSRTGSAVDLDELRAVSEAVGRRPVIVGSGATIENVHVLLKFATGVIVGTSLKRRGRLDLEKARAFVGKARSAGA